MTDKCHASQVAKSYYWITDFSLGIILLPATRYFIFHGRHLPVWTKSGLGALPPGDMRAGSALLWCGPSPVRSGDMKGSPDSKLPQGRHCAFYPSTCRSPGLHTPLLCPLMIRMLSILRSAFFLDFSQFFFPASRWLWPDCSLPGEARGKKSILQRRSKKTRGWRRSLFGFLDFLCRPAVRWYVFRTRLSHI